MSEPNVTDTTNMRKNTDMLGNPIYLWYNVPSLFHSTEAGRDNACRYSCGSMPFYLNDKQKHTKEENTIE